MNSGRRFGEDHDVVYTLLARLEPGLMVDVGAAVGIKTRQMLEHSPRSRVVAFEPFPGNLSYLERYAAGEPRLTVRPVAVADRPGRETLHVAKVAGDSGPGLPLPGFSPVGRLGRGAGGVRVAVDVVRLDDEIAEHVRFLKIDVQGGERRVLEGSAGLLARHGIDLAFVEFNGSPRVLRLLEAEGFVLFDSLYLAWPTRRYVRNWFRRRATRMPRWQGLRHIRNTIGGQSAFVWPPVPFRGFRLYCAWFVLTRIFRTGLQTDLLCVHRGFLDRFFDAVSG